MRRPSFFLIVDALGFTAFVLLTASGVLMRYVLPPGSGHFTTVWSLDRHEWGSIHFWIAVCFLAILAVHLWLHRRWIVAVVQGRPREGSGARVGLGIVGLISLLALAAAPLLSPVERPAGERAPRGAHSRSVEHRDPIRGFWTLREVEEKTGVPAAYLGRELGLPSDLSKDEHLGRLGRRYGFTMQDVRRLIEDYAREN